MLAALANKGVENLPVGGCFQCGPVCPGRVLAVASVMFFLCNCQ